MIRADSAVERDRWERRRWLAFLVRVVVFLAPAVIATDVTLVLTRYLPEPTGVPESIAWWLAALTASAVALFAFERLFRRLLPLSVLLDLALVFPGVAPSRFSAAFRAGTIKNLHRRVDEAKEKAGDADTAEAAATVVELIAALAVHDPKTRGHCERTRAYSELVAEEVGLAAEDLDRLRWSALLHDIGKLHVTAAVLNKAEPPDPAEWEALRSHPVEGARIAGALRDWLGPWGLAIEQHHEQFDGTGYPCGLVGDEISLGGRIVAVADAYEVMTSLRTYKPPVTPAAAREELVRCAGGHFDPAIVRAFLRIGIGRFPKRAGVLVGLAQLPGFAGVGQLLQQGGSAVAAGAAVVALATGGVAVPGAPGLGGTRADRGTPAPSTPTAAEASGTRRDPSATPVGSAAARLAEDSSATASPAAPASVPPAVASAGSTTAPPVLPGYYLGGTDSNQPPTPAEFRTTRPSGDAPADYDNDGRPGRTLYPSRPATSAAPEDHQLWIARFPAAVRIGGIPKLTISSAVLGFGSGRGIMRGVLLDCDGGGGSCLKRPIATASLRESEWSDGSGGFAEKTLTFSRSKHVIAAGRTLVLRLEVQNGSRPLLIAYGSASHAALLTIDIR